MENFKYIHKKPTNVIDSKERKLKFSREVDDVYLESMFSIATIVTNGSYEGPNSIAENDEATIVVTPSEGYLLPNSVSVTGASYVYDAVAGTITLSEPTAPVEVAVVCPEAIDPVLANNSWAKIRAVCEAGNAGSYWSVGDYKNVTGGDGYAKPLTIVDMSGLYGKHVVFQFRLLSENQFIWDADGVNDYAASDMNVTHLAVGGDAYLDMVDAELGAELTNTTVKVAKDGNDGTLVEITSKLFLPAEKEIAASPQYSRSEENDALSTFQYYVTHNTLSDRIINKPSASSSAYWWLRSPASGYANTACCIGYNGIRSYSIVDSYSNIAPCFAF